MRKYFKYFVPVFIQPFARKLFLSLRRRQVKVLFRNMYMRDMERYLLFSRTFGPNDLNKHISTIILQYHVIEKGLTMPETKPGFGRERIISLSDDCLKFIKTYGQDHPQLIHAISVILEYEKYHNDLTFILDEKVKNSINSLKQEIKSTIVASQQKIVSRAEYFKNVQGIFPEFSGSRSSIRNFSGEELTVNNLLKAFALAQNAPSACNRQAWRTYILTNKLKIEKLLDWQGGCRGFGHLANKLIIVTGELGVFCNTNERNQVYIDGGIYVMNLLYSLHSFEIAACVLNCSFDYEKEEQIKEFTGIKKSEVLIAFIACGYTPENFRISLSPRLSIDHIITIIN